MVQMTKRTTADFKKGDRVKSRVDSDQWQHGYFTGTVNMIGNVLVCARMDQGDVTIRFRPEDLEPAEKTA